MVGVGPVVAVDDAQLAAGDAHVVGLGVERTADVGHRDLAVDGGGRAAVEEVEPDAAELRVLRDAHLGGRERAALAQQLDVDVERRVERRRLREVHRRRRHALAREHLRHRHQALREHLAALDHVAGRVAVRGPDEVAGLTLGVHVDELEQVGGVAPRGEAVHDRLAAPSGRSVQRSSSSRRTRSW